MKGIFSTLIHIGLIAACLGGHISFAAKPQSQNKRPNILFIINDQHNPRAMGYTHQSPVITPNLDRLATQGVRFTNAYCASPVCAPTRHSIYSGLYPSDHGVLSNDRPMHEGIPTMMSYLNLAGYTTANIGKMHNAPYHHRRDFQYVLHHEFYLGPAGISHYAPYLASELKKRGLTFKPWNAPAPGLNWLQDVKTIAFTNDWLPEDLTPERWITDEALKFMRDQLAQRPNKPFFIHASYFPPHMPYGPIKKYADMYDPATMKLPKNFSRSKMNAWCRGGHKPANISDDEIKRWLACYYGFVTQLDAEIGRLLDGLDELGLADNTIVIFTSDHGDMLSEHGMFYKGVMYEGSARVPLIIRWPGMPKNKRESALVSHVDFMPTVLKAAGVTCDTKMEGMDLRPLLTGDRSAWQDRAVHSEFYSYLPFTHLMLRQGSYKLIASKHKPKKAKTKYELYDVDKDPWEMNDLTKDPAFATTFASMKKTMMSRWQRQKKKLPKAIPPAIKRSRYNITWPADPWEPVTPIGKQ